MWPDVASKTYVKDLAIWYGFGFYVLATGRSMGINIRWGGDWNSDFRINDQTFDDLCHFELRL